jgi:hypothetical protein
MRNPIRSETDAFHLALGGAGLTGASLVLGAVLDWRARRVRVGDLAQGS